MGRKIFEKLRKAVSDKFADKHPSGKPGVSDTWLRRIDIRTFIDIGAYIGEYADFAHNLYPKADIYAFEPLKEGIKVLKEKQEKISKLKVYECALGEKNGKKILYKSSYPPSSSILPMENLHKKSFPFSKKSSRKMVSVCSLDNVLAKEKLEKDIFIKMDTQGYEDKIIKGGIKIIAQAKIILTEVSFQKLYKDQAMFHKIYNDLFKLGFRLGGFRNQIFSPVDGSILQAHAYFLKPEKGASK